MSDSRVTDRDRLDWLSTATVEDDVDFGFDHETGRHIIAWTTPRGDLQTASSPDGCRAAIDAAMQRERGQ
jgi:hypothetical protein